MEKPPFRRTAYTWSGGDSREWLVGGVTLSNEGGDPPNTVVRLCRRVIAQRIHDQGDVLVYALTFGAFAPREASLNYCHGFIRSQHTDNQGMLWPRHPRPPDRLGRSRRISPNRGIALKFQCGFDPQTRVQPSEYRTQPMSFELYKSSAMFPNGVKTLNKPCLTDGVQIFCVSGGFS